MDRPRLGASLAVGGDLEGAQAQLTLASTSPQRRAILERLGIAFVAVAPEYEEIGDDPVEHAAGKARSVDGPLVLGVDTDVFVDSRRLGKAASAAEAAAMLTDLAGRAHEVVSGLCLRTPAWEELHRVVTEVSFRQLGAGEIDRYVATGEWEGRAGAYAIQGAGAALVERIEGDYLNVVGLPTLLLAGLLVERFPGRYGKSLLAAAARLETPS
ncbi:MAG TPA: Maf family nucleotide pyrophosphatase [Gaiellaceae bacterium]|nr:Maf family nucleotide pyrophosphatase [Gaiellaceae bacterium]